MNLSRKICMKAENILHIQSIRSDDELLLRIASPFPKPVDIFIARNIRILAVHALTCPIRNPVWSVFEKLCRAEGIRKHDQQLALIRVLP